ncbi:MAG TPA: hypothetical protein VMS29_07150 [Pyrinomonadaceae bacterium]|nr:hypothetical protein [Pyrinomonadaceae bacterium]
MKLRWRFGVLAGIFLAIFCLYPQFKMLYLRGDDWNGHYAYNDIDEVAYASYVRALTDGRPRKSDPYTGRDHTLETPQPESLFSIQFAAPYTIAIPARILGVGTPWAMTIAGAVAGFLAAFAAFWFIARITGDNWYAMAGSLAVFCFGTLAAGEGAALEIFFDGFSYPYFPGFRRYIPALAMPAFFAFVALLWQILNGEERPKSEGEPAVTGVSHFPFLLISLSVLCFAYCVFSYFYIWTTAAAFLGCIGLVWLVERPNGWKRDIKNFAIVGVGCLIPLIPYFYLLSKRTDTMDHVQLLVSTHAPDLFRFPEYVSFAVLILLIAGLASKAIDIKERSTLFAFALALVPFVIFNQQVVTGRSLQPIHFQVFIGNYVSTLALFVTIGILWRTKLGQGIYLPKVACSLLALTAVIWGFVECHYTVRVLDDANIERDRALPLADRLSELAGNDSDPHRTTVLSFDWLFADDMPTVAPQNILWARHQHVFAGLSWEESKERYFQQLYYQQVDEGDLDYLLKNDFVTQIALFGWGRHTDRLSVDAKPLTYGEVAEEVKKYGDYCKFFSKEQASNPLIAYVVVPIDRPFDLSTVKQWYELDGGEEIGGHKLYKARLR